MKARASGLAPAPPAASSVEGFIAARVLPEYHGIVQALRQAIRTFAPGSQEVLTYGILGFKAARIFAVISPTKKGITLAFSRGAEFEDKYQLLEGVGKVSKNLRFSGVEDIRTPVLRYYVRQALALDAR